MFEGYDVRRDPDGYFWLYFWKSDLGNIFDGKYYSDEKYGGVHEKISEKIPTEY